MHLLRVQIPEFRVLKNIDITFEKEFQPRIFPLGSQNGGGKSTLLQLIFVLLHCAGVPERHAYLKNILKNVKSFQDDSQHALAAFDIWHNNRIFHLEFLVWNADYLQNFLRETEQTRITIGTSKYLEQERLWYVTNFSSKHEDVESNALLCRIPDTDTTDIESFLNELSQKVFLTAPSTQVCLFLPQEARRLLFKKESTEKDALPSETTYSQYLHHAKFELPGFFTYDFIAIDAIIELVKAARDQDFEEKFKTGQYGNHYETLTHNLHTLLITKKLRPMNRELSEITFEAERDGTVITLYPEDLSHGELRRLSIYAWLKSRQIEDAIVLIDEIEIALHPDWEYQIVGDLAQWEPNNQYILATHSYELCQALTPAHVKELEPKLLKPAVE